MNLERRPTQSRPQQQRPQTSNSPFNFVVGRFAGMQNGGSSSLFTNTVDSNASLTNTSSDMKFWNNTQTTRITNDLFSSIGSGGSTSRKGSNLSSLVGGNFNINTANCQPPRQIIQGSCQCPNNGEFLSGRCNTNSKAEDLEKLGGYTRTPGGDRNNPDNRLWGAANQELIRKAGSRFSNNRGGMITSRKNPR